MDFARPIRRILATDGTFRNYHSDLLLLRDCRVLAMRRRMFGCDSLIIDPIFDAMGTPDLISQS